MLTSWMDHIVKNSNHIVLCFLQQNTVNPQIIFTVIVYSNLTYSIKTNNHHIPKNITIINASDIFSLLTYITSLNVCPGNPDSAFLKLAEERKTKTFLDREGKGNIYIHHFYLFVLGQIIAIIEDMPDATVRHTQCPVLQEKNSRCGECISYRRNLLAIHRKECII